MNLSQLAVTLAFLGRSNCRAIVIQCVLAIALICSGVVTVNAQEITFPPNTPVCVMDLDGNGDVSAANELERCGEGQVFNSITGLPGPDRALRCPLGRTMCEEPELNTCPIDGTLCGDTDISCTRPLACVETTWSEDQGVGTIIYTPAEPERYLCEFDGVTYDNLADAIAACTETIVTPITGTVTYIPPGPTQYFCTYDGVTYDTFAAAEAACTVSETTPSPYNTIPGTSDSWYCAFNDQTYTSLSSAEAGCVEESVVQQPGAIITLPTIPETFFCQSNGVTYPSRASADAFCVVDVTVRTPQPLVFSEGMPESYFCPANGVTYATEAAAMAGCTETTVTNYAVNTIDGSTGGYFCDLDGILYDNEADALAACNTTDVTIINHTVTTIPATVESWYCQENDTHYSSEALAIGSCRIIVDIDGFDCPSTPGNDRYPTRAACEAACNQTQACQIEIGPMQCPLDGALPCINEADGSEVYYCSPNACGTYEDEGDYQPPSDSFTPNDGTIDPVDGCLDQIQIFNGKAESCRLPGVASAFQNCCNEADEDLLTDSQGSVSEAALWAGGVNALFDAGAAAYAAYTGLPAGTTVGAAAGQTASAFQSALLESLGSTTMIVAVGVAAVTAYLENACPPEGVVTAIKKKSNQCVLIGEKCTTRILGACLQKREIHCCFNSLMATLVQKGGRAQLGMNFGTVDNPNCRGFTPEEFQSIDFSKIDLSEYYAEIETRAQSDIQDEITTVINNARDGI
ncbi:conjugal transfer protein TraN [Alteromonas macleodii]|uniref:Type-1V conjugative transfer system mating pair stabilization family protein n=1 Tax=Alteromonas macleodii TaxID=28108 RepID=A0AB36FMC1_ALTMA|nr:conjugal transfer protein TraN [Alteromonas macleodii]OES24219.1 type-1V conjugative transfer system mating pair stabilization family protein [Alteromonas macleodii]OES24850.1 type-1V conjugative transfer system mating pair stabilization family protein [Alteromonas macleodii]OES25128.1 type-1V conjugative transfer system mating pair stabilization family protein [Alteromonas macleodii]OES39170.1 type-1V conjugative transfer system mating pair stabilization family protein [Alteromonas macleodi